MYTVKDGIKMKENKIIILADDLTGANDTAIQFAKHGLQALVIPYTQFPDSALGAGFQVFSLNSDSRPMDGSLAYDTLRNLVKRIKSLRPSGNYYKKIDSVLRGNPGPELAAVMDELETPLAIVAPSFPANRSTVENGMLKSGALNITVDAVNVFASSMNKKVEGIPLEKIRLEGQQCAEYVLERVKGGVEVFVADAVDDDDLAGVYRLSSALLQPHILVGSAGLGNQIAENLKAEEKPLPSKRPVFSDPCGPLVLMIAGTRQGETAAQITCLCETMASPVICYKTDLVINGKAEEANLLAYEEAAYQIKNKAKLCIIAVESLFTSEIQAGDVNRMDKAQSDLYKMESEAISSGLGILAGSLMESFKFQVLISTGGDTSLEVCKHLGVGGIQPLAEICPGIPIGRIVGGSYENSYIITKSGRFGVDNTLVEVMDYLGVPRA